MRNGHAVGLAWFFLRARPVRSAALIALATALVLMAVVMTLQSFRSSGVQDADMKVGSSANMIQSDSTVALGEDGGDLDRSLVDGMLAAGATDASVVYRAYDLVADDDADVSLALLENDWAADPFPGRYALDSGRLPETVGEVTISTSAATRHPLGSQIKLFNGGLAVTVVGVITDDFARSFNFMLAPTGTWNSLSEMNAEDAARYSITASRDLYFSGGDRNSVFASIASVLDDPDTTVEVLRELLWNRGELEVRTPSPRIEIDLTAFVAPLLTGLIGAWFAARFVNRIRSTMVTIGVPRPRTRVAALIAIVASVGIGSSIGSIVGIVIGFALRPAVDAVSYKAIGPVYDVGLIAIRVLGIAVIGALVGALVLGRESKRRKTVAPRRRILTLHTVSPIVALALIGTAIYLLQPRRYFDEKFLGGLAIGLAIIILAPLLLDAVVRMKPASLAAALGLRRLRTERRASGWIVIGIGTLVLLSFVTSTLFYSGRATANESQESEVPPGQVRLEPMQPNDEQIEALRLDFEAHVGVESPLTTYMASGSTDLGEGSTDVVESGADLERLTGKSLSPSELALLESGGTLRTKSPEITTVTFEAYDEATENVTTFEMPSLTIIGIDSSFTTIDGFILESTAAAHDVNLVRKTFVYPDVSKQQLALASAAPTELGFESSWVQSYSAPVEFTEPLESLLTGLMISLLAGSLMAFYASSAARSLRPVLAGLRSVGVSRSWLRTTLAVQTGTLVATAVVVATVAACVGVFVMLRIGFPGISFRVPWQSIGVTIVLMAAFTAAGVALAVRRLRPTERLDR